MRGGFRIFCRRGLRFFTREKCDFLVGGGFEYQACGDLDFFVGQGFQYFAGGNFVFLAEGISIGRNTAARTPRTPDVGGNTPIPARPSTPGNTPPAPKPALMPHTRATKPTQDASTKVPQKIFHPPTSPYPTPHRPAPPPPPKAKTRLRAYMSTSTCPNPTSRKRRPDTRLERW